MSITIEKLVDREVHYCVSYLVSTLASGLGNDTAGTDLADMISQAFELASPIDDWEEAAGQEGWLIDGHLFVNHQSHTTAETSPDGENAWQELCEEWSIEPYAREVYEHWIVSDWLADRLAEHGEKVDKDFGGMIVWARTTSGQGIASDSVIERIHAHLTRGA